MSDQQNSPQSPQGTPSVSADDRTGGVVVPTLVQSIAQSQPIVPQVEPQQISTGSKEKGGVTIQESVPVVEVNTGASAIEKEPLPPEVESWMEKVGHDEAQVKLDTLPPVQVPPPAHSDVTSSGPVFVLPLGQQEMQAGLHASVNDSIKWLATWAKRIIKQFKGQAVFRNT